MFRHRYLIFSFPFQTYLDICEVGTVFCRPKLIQAVDLYIRIHFDEFVTTPAFYDLPLTDLNNYLKNRNLKTTNEETVLSAAIRWCRHNQKWDKFPNLALNVQFNLISVKYLCTILREESEFKVIWYFSSILPYSSYSSVHIKNTKHNPIILLQTLKNIIALFITRIWHLVSKNWSIMYSTINAELVFYHFVQLHSDLKV